VSKPTVHTITHTIDIAASPEVVFPIIADVTRWPEVFGPTVYAERLEGDDTSELIQLWATANGTVRTWTSRRRIDRAAQKIEFAQQRSPAPLASMGGSWSFQPLDDGGTRAVLDHYYSVIDDDPQGLEWVRKAVDTNSNAELAALKAVAEIADRYCSLTTSFSDSVTINGKVDDVYEFLYRADLWPQRLPHVSRLELTEEIPNIQVMEMDTRTADGSVHTTKSVRVCFPTNRIVYKQIVVPKLMAIHTGVWTLTTTDDGLTATSTHTVRINPDNVTAVLGADATVEQAKDFVRNALSRNSLATLGLAKEYAETKYAEAQR